MADPPKYTQPLTPLTKTRISLPAISTKSVDAPPAARPQIMFTDSNNIQRTPADNATGLPPPGLMRKDGQETPDGGRKKKKRRKKKVAPGDPDPGEDLAPVNVTEPTIPAGPNSAKGKGPGGLPGMYDNAPVSKPPPRMPQLAPEQLRPASRASAQSEASSRAASPALAGQRLSKRDKSGLSHRTLEVANYHTESNKELPKPRGILLFRTMTSLLLITIVILTVMLLVYGNPKSLWWQGCVLLFFLTGVIALSSLATVLKKQWYDSQATRTRSSGVVLILAALTAITAILTIVHWDDITAPTVPPLPTSIIFGRTEYALLDGTSPLETTLGCESATAPKLPVGWDYAEDNNATLAVIIGTRARFGAECVEIGGRANPRLIDSVTGKACEVTRNVAGSTLDTPTTASCFKRTLIEKRVGKPQAATFTTSYEVMRRVSHRGRQFAVMNDVSPHHLQYKHECHDIGLKIPAGWQLAPLATASRQVVALYPWAGACIVFADGTALKAQTMEACGNNELLHFGSFVATKSKKCDQLALIERVVS